jgi:DNA polymerase I-like protein with 3'-5' exonuclease and polymerase domains
VLDHLESIGLIKKRKEAEDIFIRHVKDVEKAYWKKFHVFKDWQEELYKKYERDGTIELFTGFRCKGYLGRNELVNYLFQGTAFHCLLWSVIQINAELCERDMRSRIIAQIHDNAILDCPPEETKAVYDLSTEIATSRIRIAYPWIKVPLLIDWEETGIDESWYSKKEIMDDEEE